MKRIAELRKEQRLSQTLLAEHVGVSQGALSYWENGEYEPDQKCLIKLADFFDVSVDYLLERTDKRKTEIIIEAAAAHFDTDKLTPEGRRIYENTIRFLVDTHLNDD